MTTAVRKVNEETELRQLIDEWTKALRAKDIDGVMANYAPDVVVFGITGPLKYSGWKQHREFWENMFKTIDGPIDYEMRDLTITAKGDVAFSHGINRMGGRSKKGPEDTWIRVTVCYRRTNGKWLVTHEHVSVPFDMKTGQALMDLKP
jgi:uncharacterized protein (TIGR02246 family)